VAVTGSDGKTTTTTLISEMLKAEGKTVWLGGNIGTPLLPLLDGMAKDDFAVVELSSFQLMDMRRSPHVALITNLAPNHLDIHKDME
jgi:UDP-N-acetylmuramoylalanine--D-glutamate ligase